MKPVGTIGLAENRKQWIVSGPPHFLIRVKRIFEGVSKQALGQVEISDTAEHCRDLLWMRERYALDIGDDDLAYMESQARAFDARRETLEAILSPDYEAPAFDLALPPRDYQKRAAAVYLAQGSLLLADDLGLGKTCSAICSLTDPRTLPAVVVCYPHLQRQWQREIEKFAPSLITHIAAKRDPYDLPTFIGRSPDVVIISYHKLDGWQDALASYARSIIFDEVQELRRSGSNKYVAAERIANAVPFRMGLTATPIYNYGGEMHAILSVLSPGALGTSWEFYREWCTGHIDKARIKDPPTFGSYVREQGLMLRRTRAEVGRELPPVNRIVHDVDSDASALEKVEDKASELARIILSRSAQPRGAAMEAAQEFSNIMRQATGIAKAPYVAEFVKLLASSGEPIVLCGWHRAVYDIWRDRLEGLRVGMYTGEETPAHKDETRAKMIAGELDVMILSLRSGAGLDGLQDVCRNIVFGELDWSPGVHEQCVGRIHRDGQDQSVNAYFLIADTGADPIMCRVLGLKRDQVEGIRNPDGALIEDLSRASDHIQQLAAEFLKRTPAEAAA